MLLLHYPFRSSGGKNGPNQFNNHPIITETCRLGPGIACNNIRNHFLKTRYRRCTRTTSTELAVQVFHPNDIDSAVVVSSVYWDNLKANFATLLGVQLLAILVGLVLVGTFANQLPTFLSGFVVGTTSKEDKNKNNEENLQMMQPLRISTVTAQSPTNPTINFSKLLLCLTIDSIGTMSELIPFLGEVADVVWAPIAAIALRSLYSGSNIIFILELLEEILPFTDIIPLATLCWFIENFYGDSDLAKLLRIGEFDNDTTATLISPPSIKDSSADNN